MIKLIYNTFKVLIKKKGFILMGIILPAFITVFFSFEFGDEYNYKVGIIDNDGSYMSREIVKSISNLEDIDIVNVKESDYKLYLLTQQIQMVIVIDENFQEKLLNLQNQEIKIKSISESDIKSTIESMIKLKIDDLILISQLSDNDLKKFVDLNNNYNDMPTQLTLNDIKEKSPGINKSLGIIILVVFILGGNLTNYLIEDEENNIKIRVISSGISEGKYYFSMITVFYILSCISSLIYYCICKLFNIDFGMNCTVNFLLVLFILNLFSVSINLLIGSFFKNRYTANIINILIIVPSCMLSGVFWDFKMMPINLQSLGSIIPIRWIYLCIERLQHNNSMLDIKIYTFSIIILSIMLIIISTIKIKYTKKQRYKRKNGN